MRALLHLKNWRASSTVLILVDVSKLVLPYALELMLPRPRRNKDDTDLAAREYLCPACDARADFSCWWAEPRADRGAWLSHPSRRALVSPADTRFRILTGVATLDELRAFFAKW